ncbi:MAG: hypothetical protein PVI02_06225, partial [Gammaproteobacteria bacterium]
MKFAIHYDAALAGGPVDGRIILLISDRDDVEPRFQVQPGIKAIQLFGMDVENLSPGVPATIDDDAFGYPRASLADLPAGEYVVQAVLNRYEEFALASGHRVKLPPDRGEGQKWNKKPGNFYSAPMRIRIDADSTVTHKIWMEEVIPPIEPPGDSKYVKHVRIQSQRLTDFWGRPMYLGAHVLLPEGFEEHREARYP